MKSYSCLNLASISKVSEIILFIVGGAKTVDTDLEIPMNLGL